MRAAMGASRFKAPVFGGIVRPEDFSIEQDLLQTIP
jgi:hypothetical protein